VAEQLLFELSTEGKKGVTLPDIDVAEKALEELIPPKYIRSTPLRLPELSEPEIVRHFVNLSVMNHHVDKGIYPLGSCTMKYNPKINEDLARLEGFANVHPLQPEDTVQGAMRLMHELACYLCEISGLKAVCLQPSAGAHGELTGLMMIRAYHDDHGSARNKVLIPDSAHGTNPASVTISGFRSQQIKSNAQGLVDIEDLRTALDEDVAALMLTNPNTLGLFESEVDKIIRLVHDVGALVYMDGANLNALLGIVRPGDLGFDVVHFNLHKTFSTPHGGGGPGAGPVGVSEQLMDFLPVPFVLKKGDTYTLEYCRAHSIGKVSSFYGNFGVMVKAYVFIRMLGAMGLRKVSENAIINANYLLSLVREYFDLAYDATPMHEFVLSGNRQAKQGVKTLDMAKRLLDFGVHAPTVYFPLIVHEALMVEPTESESKLSLENFADILIQIAKEVHESPAIVKDAPTKTPVSRLDEVRAAREMNIRYEYDLEEQVGRKERKAS
jgi:glycine dehydrogenase subunit 2